MQPEREQRYNKHLIQEYYWNGKMVVYVDHHLSQLSFGDAFKELAKNECQEGVVICKDNS